MSASLDSPSPPRPASDPATKTADRPGGGQADPVTLSYEQARDALVAIVGRLESGQVPLEEATRLWERSEALAARCEALLDAAQAAMDAVDPAEPADRLGPAT